MRMNVTSRMRWSVVGTLAALTLGLAGPSASALGPGALPVITFSE
jgi:hypothetical protein